MPTIAQGATGSVAWTNESGSLGADWEIHNGATLIADANTPNGWLVELGALVLDITVPITATVDTGYTADWQPGFEPDHVSAAFDVTPSTAATVESRRFFVPGNRGVWTDSGMVLGPTDSLRVRAEGLVRFDTYVGACAWPEGLYPVDDNPCDPNHPYDPDSTVGYLVPEDIYIVTNTKPMCLSMVLRDEGVTPDNGFGSISDGVLCTRDETFNLPSSGGTKRVWFIFNDFRHYSLNTGGFDLILDRLNDDEPPPNVDYGPAVGGRTVPTRLMQVYQSQEQAVCFMWFIQPVRGAAEAYTSLDIDLSAPAYVSPLNGLNPIPAMTYLSQRGVDISAIPAALKMESKGVDVAVLNFNRDKLKAGWYDGAEIELFEVNWKGNLADRVVLFSGQIGTAEVGDLQATVQLLSWEDLANKPIGDTVSALCRHQFCGPGCRVESIDSGPVLSDFTRSGEVTAVTSGMKFRVEVTGSEGGVDFFDHLAEGRVRFTSGANDEAVRDVKTGVLISGSIIELVLHQAAPSDVEMGDTVEVSMGCRKDFAIDCAFYDNKINFGGFPFIPLREGVMRRG